MVMVITRPVLSPTPYVLCIICKQPVKPDQATSGSLYANHQQAYACSNHLYNRRLWVPAWAAFDTTQQSRKKDRGQK